MFKAYKGFSVLDIPWYIGPLALVGAAAIAIHEAAWSPFHAIDFGRDLLIIASFSALLPFLFRWSRHSAVDGFLGSLSYPIYVCHLAVLFAFSQSHVVQAELFSNLYVRFAAYLTLVLLTALTLTIAVERPFERLRHRLLPAKASIPVQHRPRLLTVE